METNSPSFVPLGRLSPNCLPRQQSHGRNKGEKGIGIQRLGGCGLSQPQRAHYRSSGSPGTLLPSGIPAGPCRCLAHRSPWEPRECLLIFTFLLRCHLFTEPQLDHPTYNCRPTTPHHTPLCLPPSLCPSTTFQSGPLKPEWRQNHPDCLLKKTQTCGASPSKLSSDTTAACPGTSL